MKMNTANKNLPVCRIIYEYTGNTSSACLNLVEGKAAGVSMFYFPEDEMSYKEP